MEFGILTVVVGAPEAPPEAFAMRASPKGKQLFAAEVQRWVLEQAPLARLSYSLKERKIWLLWFAPFRIAKNLVGNDDQRR